MGFLGALIGYSAGSMMNIENIAFGILFGLFMPRAWLAVTGSAISAAAFNMFVTIPKIEASFGVQLGPLNVIGAGLGAAIISLVIFGIQRLFSAR